MAGNYRVDVLGWIALEELGAEDGANGSYGNYGLRDQRAAMQVRWEGEGEGEGLRGSERWEGEGEGEGRGESLDLARWYR